MLVLTRKSGEAIRIGGDIKVVVVEVKENHVKLGIEAPAAMSVHREEIFIRIQEENLSASTLPADVSDTLKRLKNK